MFTVFLLVQGDTWWMFHKPFAIHRSHRASVIRMSKSIKGINSTHVEYSVSSHAFYNIYLTHHLVSEVVTIMSNFSGYKHNLSKSICFSLWFMCLLVYSLETGYITCLMLCIFFLKVFAEEVMLHYYFIYSTNMYA